MPGYLTLSKKKRSLLISTLLLFTTVVAWGNTTYIFAKAQLAQYLIAEAWEQTLRSGKNSKPWSWADTWPVARLLSEKHMQDLYVLAGASGTSLAFGPGHLDGSALPGENGSIIIGGHRDTHFSFLREIKINDQLKIQDKRGQWKVYLVVDTWLADAQKDTLNMSVDDNELVLITCYPFDSIVPGGPLRYVVRAERT